MQKKTAFILLGILVVVCSITIQQTYFSSAHRKRQENQPWQRRAALTADDPKAARAVIIDSIYAGKTIVVTQAYEESLEEKPWRTNRIITFAHAAEVMNRYSRGEIGKGYDNSENFDTTIKLLNQARAKIKTLTKPPNAAKVHTKIGRDDQQKFLPTQVADAWLAASNFSGDPEAYVACQKAIQLDPSFGEAYYELGTKYTVSKTAQMQHPGKAAALSYLSHAEQLEPKLHPLVSYQRYLIAKEEGNNRAAADYLREYLRLWPNAFRAQEARQELAQLEASQQQKHGV